jgi:phosphoesterase RecJ-like protein
LQPEAPATGLILADLAKEWGIPFDEELASLLYIAIYTDTGGFRYANTDEKTFATAAELVKAGADPSYLATEFHENVPLGRVRLFSKVLDNLQVEMDGRIVWVTVPLAAMEEHGCDRSDIEGFVEYLRGIELVKVAVLFRESEAGKTKMSFRSKDDIDCSRIAAEFGGGGHMHAAGADIHVGLEEAVKKVLPQVRGIIAHAQAETGAPPAAGSPRRGRAK